MEKEREMSKLIQYQIPAILESIYESEIPCRLEWRFDGGFIWSIQNNDYPRLWKDEQSEQTVMCETTENMLLRNNPLLEKDWIARGGSYSFMETVEQLADEVCKLFPQSKFAKWYKR